MRGSLKTSGRWCRDCKAQVAAVSNSTAWGCGDLIMIILTIGLWVPIRFVLMAMSNPWRCPRCGGRV